MRQQTQHATDPRFFRRCLMREGAREWIFAALVGAALAIVPFAMSALVFAAIHFIASDDEPARKTFNAEKFDWAQVQGKTVKNAAPSENGTKVTLSFTDGTHVEISSSKYTLSVN